MDFVVWKRLSSILCCVPFCLFSAVSAGTACCLLLVASRQNSSLIVTLAQANRLISPNTRLALGLNSSVMFRAYL